VNLLQAIDDPKLFAPWFRDRTTWAPWRAFIATLFAHALDDGQRAIYKQCTDRDRAPVEPFREAWLVIGRRGGKSFVMALVAVFLAAFKDYSLYLAPGERATVMVIAADRKQARVIMRYVRALLTGVPMLARMIEKEAQESFDLSNSTTIEVGTANFRTTRGYTFAAVLADEIAFWRSEESANPDVEVLAAIRPGMVTIPTSILIRASSPHARSGALWEAFSRHWGKDLEPLVWKAPTLVMNPTIPVKEIEAAYEKDSAWAAAEYGAEFRSDLEAFLNREAVDKCVSPGVFERPPNRDYHYSAFVDPSGGASDSFTLAIAHAEGQSTSKTAILDALREVRPPFSPEAVVSEFAELMKKYRISKCRGDRYAGEWPREQFRKHGVNYEPSDKNRSELYRDLLAPILSGAVDLLDNQRLRTQLVGLERRTTRGGRDTIDHRSGAGWHDDLANVAAGALVNAQLSDDERIPAPPRRPAWAMLGNDPLHDFR